MVPILPPSLSVTFIVAALLPLVIGFVVGLLIKNFLEVGLVIAAILLVLIASERALAAQRLRRAADKLDEVLRVWGSFSKKGIK